MGKNERNLIIAIVILAACGACVFGISTVKRAPSRAVKLMEFPLNLGEWTGKDIKFEDKEYEKQVYEILGTDKVLIRAYSDRKNESAAVQVVYSDQKRQSFHPPEYCYLGSGANELLETGKAQVALEDGKVLPVNRTVYQTKRGKVLMLDWYTAGDMMTGNYYKQQMYFMINQLKRAKSGGSAVRVWTPIIGNDVDAAFDRCRRLIREMVKLLPDYL
ncbi:MAG: EpsI family protein [Candidatus Omnitrophica bacterium]|nr:EpsI family protein [Candidatus Omnitrophota bacterium]